MDGHVHPEFFSRGFDTEAVLAAIVSVRTDVPADGFTAEVLGTQRAGSGVIIRKDGLVLTVGYLIAEADTVWVTLSDGTAHPGHALAYDFQSGLGLVQILAQVDLPVMPTGSAAGLEIADPVVIAAAGGPGQALASHIVARREFAGYWEYVLPDALFIAPAHDNWGGAALINEEGKLIGIGSLLVQGVPESGDPDDAENLNMCVPIDQLEPVLDDLLSRGRRNAPPRPWLGVYAMEVGNHIMIADLASKGPAAGSDLETGDVVVGVAGEDVESLAGFFKQVWALGEAGIEVPLRILRDGQTLDISIRSGDRGNFLKAPTAH
ncbi:MAG: S1C family serine protease [Alphaproteobacteria bacterium]